MTRPHQLTPDRAAAYLDVALANVARVYPNHPGHLLTSAADLQPPEVLHPVFAGSFDWHSSVHQHWLLVRLLRRAPDLPGAAAARRWFDACWTPDAMATEAAYLAEPARRSFERPYGWAWLMTLAAELTTAGGTGSRTTQGTGVDPVPPGPPATDARRWAAALTPVTEVVRAHCLTWLASSPLPERSGTHASSAFAALLLHDAARATGDTALATAVDAAARRWYADDRDAPTRYEPSATDFLSPTLVSAVLMAEVLPAAQAAPWLAAFLTDPAPLTHPVAVSDPTDPKVVHLDGLNLSRAWCWRRLAAHPACPARLRSDAEVAADRHLDVSLPATVSGRYVGDHWLSSFAVLALEA